MNDQRVRSTRVPYLPVTIVIDGFESRDFEALVDTGFQGSVIVPTGTYSSQRPPAFRTSLRLADDTPRFAPSYNGALHIGASRLAPVTVMELGGEALIGMTALRSFTLTVDHGQTISVEP